MNSKHIQRILRQRYRHRPLTRPPDAERRNHQRAAPLPATPLGKGGMGDVYVGRDVHLDREIALKFISVEYAENETWKRRFLREAKAASRLTHPNLGIIYEVGEWQGTMFLAMEYVKRETLSHRLKRGRLPFSETRDSTLQLTDVLRAAHEEGIIRRDLKPGNILTPHHNRQRSSNQLAANEAGRRV